MFSKTLKIAAVGGALVLGLSASAFSNGWIDAHHRDFVTFSGPVALPGVTLPAGTYRFEMPSASPSDGIVSVSSRDGRKVYLTQFTRLIDRPRGGEQLTVTLGESAPGLAPQVKAWYPVGSNEGRQFIYN